MRIVQVSQSDVGGGAAVVMQRLHNEFIAAGHESKLLVLSAQKKFSHTTALVRPSILARVIWRAMDMLEYKRPPSFAIFSHYIPWALRTLRRLKPDVVLLHIPHHVLSAEDIASLDVPTFWAIHDCDSFTAGCQLLMNCNGYESGCKKCPHIGYRQREKIWQSGVIGVGVSKAAAEAAKKATVTHGAKIYSAPNGVPLDVFTSARRENARRLFGFDENKKYVMVGTSANASFSKGGDVAEYAAKKLAARFGDKVGFISVGHPPLRVEGSSVFEAGFVNDPEMMANLFAASDLVLFPSRSEMGPLTVVETIASGTPIVVFDIPALREITQGIIGARVVPYNDLDAFARAAEELLLDEKVRGCMSMDDLKKFDIKRCASDWLALFHAAIEARNQ